MARFVVLFDANVLYPAQLRSLLLYTAGCDIFQARWTDRIQDEWMRNLLINRPDLTREALERVRAAMDRAQPHAKVSGFEVLEEKLTLPDPDDRHVLAAAIVGKVDVIVTLNHKDFPEDILATYGIEAQTPDEFLSAQISLEQSKVLDAVRTHWRSLANPPFTLVEYLDLLTRNGFEESVEMLRPLLLN
jgi:predicted nucleic acid-binding protein